jgi:hypothetical protein
LNTNLEKPKNYYDLLALDPLCSTEEIKHAFRQQIALSHPDKVSHLAREIQDLALMRTAELTEAYRILSNGQMRFAYDRQLEETAKAGVPAIANYKADKHEEPTGGIGRGDFINKSVLARLKSAIQEILPGMPEVPIGGFEASFANRRKWNILSNEKGCTQVLVRALPLVDSQAVEDGWGKALKAVRDIDGDIYLFLAGVKLDGADKLSAAILDMQRRSRLQNGTRILVVPLNVHSFSALIPNGAPEPLRAIIHALKTAH